jgi:hypothetical protein
VIEETVLVFMSGGKRILFETGTGIGPLSPHAGRLQASLLESTLDGTSKRRKAIVGILVLPPTTSLWYRRPSRENDERLGSRCDGRTQRAYGRRRLRTPSCLKCNNAQNIGNSLTDAHPLASDHQRDLT